MAFDEHEISGVNLDQMMALQSMGPNMEKVTVDPRALSAQFSMAHGPGYTPVEQMGVAMQQAMDPVMNDPNPIELKNRDPLWDNTGAERNPVLNGIENAANNLNATSDGAMRIGAEIGNNISEAVTGLFDLLNPAANDPTPEPRMAMQGPPPPQPGLFG